MKNVVIEHLSAAADAALVRLGADIGIAIKARETYSAFASRVGVSRVTLRKLIRGEPGVSSGTLMAVLDALELLGHIQDVATPERDAIGQALRLRGKARPDEGFSMNTDF